MRNFESLTWLWKNEILFFSRFLPRSSTFTYRMVTIRRALESHSLIQSFKYPKSCHIIHKKNCRVVWIQNVHEKSDEKPEISRMSSGFEKQNFSFWPFLKCSFTGGVDEILSFDYGCEFQYFLHAWMKFSENYFRKNIN